MLKRVIQPYGFHQVGDLTLIETGYWGPNGGEGTLGTLVKRAE